MHNQTVKQYGLSAAMALSLLAGTSTQATASDYAVKLATIEDKKAVFATVESTDSIAARVRIAGTLTQLTVTEGSEVKEGQVIALVGDPKLALRIQAIDAQIKAAEREIENISVDRERFEKLHAKGSIAKSRLDQITTQFDVANNKLEASRAERAVVVRQQEEGAVLAPQSGRVLDVPLTIGSVVMPGEAVATIARDNFIMRLSLPERHARFLQKGDAVDVAGRGENCDETCARAGKIVKVYPQIANGRVLADATVEGLGTYFVGERIQVRVGAGERDTMMIPRDYVFTRYGIDFVKSRTKDGQVSDIAIQVGQAQKIDDADMLEVLSGLKSGDLLVKP